MAQQTMPQNTTTITQQKPVAQQTTQPVQPVQKQATTPSTPGKTPATGQPAAIMPTKKSLFKEWWFWLIVGLGIVIILFAAWYLFF